MDNTAYHKALGVLRRLNYLSGAVQCQFSFASIAFITSVMPKAMVPPKGLTKVEKLPNLQHFALLKKKFPGGMPPDPPNSRIYSVSLALAATGPRQCERLEPSVDYVTSINELRYPLMKTHLIVLHFF